MPVFRVKAIAADEPHGNAGSKRSPIGFRRIQLMIII
jgi:hypothetical protein